MDFQQQPSYNPGVEHYIDNAYNAKRWWNVMFYGTIGVHAGQNWYDATGDLASSVLKGIKAAVRWKIWFGTLSVWCILFLITNWVWGESFDSKTDISPVWAQQPGLSDKVIAISTLAMIVSVISGFIALGLTYVTAIDAGLFKQRLIYRLLYRPTYWVRNIPWWMLHMAVLSQIGMLYWVVQVVPDNA